METLSLHRNLKIIDKYLNSLELPSIKVENNNYSLKLSNWEKEKIFETMQAFTPDQRKDYLFIKLFLEGFINLENEREFLDISRSTINRDFNIVREELENLGISVIYIHSKGLSISEERRDAYLSFWKKILKFLVHEEFLPKKIRDYLTPLFPMDKNEFFLAFDHLFKENGLKYGELLFQIFYAYNIAFALFDNFSIPQLDKKIDDSFKDHPEFPILVEKLSQSGLISSNPKFYEYAAELLLNLKLNGFYTDKALYFPKNFFIFFKESFMLHSSVPDILKNTFLQKLNTAIFKSSIEIIEIHSWTFSEQDKKIISLLENSLKNVGITLSYPTLTTLIPIVKQIILNEIIQENSNVLVLLNNIELFDFQELNQRFRFISKNIRTSFEPHLYYKYAALNNELKNFDFVISDFAFTPLYNNKIFKVKNFHSSDFEDKVKDYFIKTHLEQPEEKESASQNSPN